MRDSVYQRDLTMDTFIRPVDPTALVVPIMTREAFANAIGLPIGVLIAQCDRGYWPQVTKGKRVFINVEAVRLEALQRARDAGL